MAVTAAACRTRPWQPPSMIGRVLMKAPQRAWGLRSERWCNENNITREVRDTKTFPNPLKMAQRGLNVTAAWRAALHSLGMIAQLPWLPPLGSACLSSPGLSQACSSSTHETRYPFPTHLPLACTSGLAQFLPSRRSNSTRPMPYWHSTSTRPCSVGATVSSSVGGEGGQRWGERRGSRGRRRVLTISLTTNHTIDPLPSLIGEGEPVVDEDVLVVPARIAMREGDSQSRALTDDISVVVTLT